MCLCFFFVSTHSRPKAADRVVSQWWGQYLFQHTAARRRLSANLLRRAPQKSFNTQPPEGGCWANIQRWQSDIVSTHSRPKAAEAHYSNRLTDTVVSTHSRPKAAAFSTITICARSPVSTHSRPKAAAYFESVKAQNTCFNTQPPEGGCLVTSFNGVPCAVSTHSRPKAAVFPCRAKCDRRPVSTHSRPKAAGV